MRSFMLKLSLYGEQPKVAADRYRDWSDYLDQVEQNEGRFVLLVETLVGTVTHVLWRLYSGESRSTVPMSATAIGIGIATVTFPILNDQESWLPEVHLAIGALAVGLLLISKPWEFVFTYRWSAAWIFTATGLFHSVTAADAVNNGSTAFQAAVALCAVTSMVFGVSSLWSKQPLGHNIIVPRALAGSLGVIAVVQLFELTQEPSLWLAIAWAVLATACYWFATRFLRLADLEPTIEVNQ